MEKTIGEWVDEREGSERDYTDDSGETEKGTLNIDNSAPYTGAEERDGGGSSPITPEQVLRVYMEDRFDEIPDYEETIEAVVEGIKIYKGLESTETELDYEDLLDEINPYLEDIETGQSEIYELLDGEIIDSIDDQDDMIGSIADDVTEILENVEEIDLESPSRYSDELETVIRREAESTRETVKDQHVQTRELVEDKIRRLERKLEPDGDPEDSPETPDEDDEEAYSPGIWDRAGKLFVDIGDTTNIGGDNE